MSLLMNELKKKDKKGLLSQQTANLGYPTKLLPLDFRNGYQVNVYDKNGDVTERWANIGLFGGSFITVCGKSGTAKTAFCVQSAAEICRNYEHAEIFHLDLEGSSNLSRLMKLAQYDRDMMDDKYHYFTDYHYIEDIFELISNIAEFKIANKDTYLVNSKKKSEFGEDEVQLAPTVIIIDSIPMIVTKDVEGDNQMVSGTYANRVAKAIGQFYKRLRPVIGRANIIVMVINHINAKIEINPMAHTQAQIMYLKSDESLPGGNAPIYLSQTLLKFVQCGKYVDEKDGFNGFAIRVELIKSKTNRGGSACTIIYDMENGFDPYKTIIEFAKENNLLSGRNPYSYFTAFPDKKFDSRLFSNLCAKDPELYKTAMIACGPALYGFLANAEDLKEIEAADAEALDRLGLSEEV